MNKVTILFLCATSLLLSGCINIYKFDPRIKIENSATIEEVKTTEFQKAQFKLIFNELKILRKAYQRVGLNAVSIETIFRNVFLHYLIGYTETNKKEFDEFNKDLQLQYKLDGNTDFLKHRYRSKTYCLLQPTIVSRLAKRMDKIELFAEKNIFLTDQEVFKYVEVKNNKENKLVSSIKEGTPQKVLDANLTFKLKYGESYENYILNIETRYKEALPVETFSECSTSFKEQFDPQKVQFLAISDLFE